MRVEWASLDLTITFSNQFFCSATRWNYDEAVVLISTIDSPNNRVSKERRNNLRAEKTESNQNFHPNHIYN